ncbi:MAG: Bacterial regulatory protein luxR family [Solirubrobacteraceae bacterium]|nr:Bacterial regulatory protein luxR family [Solirubrobacteraceae bacterium]
MRSVTPGSGQLTRRSASADPGVRSAPVAVPDHAQAAVSMRVFAIAIALGLWVAMGNFVLAMTSPAEAPIRRLVIGVLFVLSFVGALWRRQAACTALRARPWLIVIVAVLSLAAALADGVDGPYLAISQTVIGVAVVVARPRMVWVCAGVLEVVYAAAVLVAPSPGGLSDDLGQLVAYPFTAAVFLGLASLYMRFLGDISGVLAEIRDGTPALTPALGQAIQLGGGRRLGMLPAPPPRHRLTTVELRVVDGLASGMAPKQLAYDWGVSLATIRTHIRAAKRKTGARTLPELAVIAAPRKPREGG